MTPSHEFGHWPMDRSAQRMLELLVDKFILPNCLEGITALDLLHHPVLNQRAPQVRLSKTIRRRGSACRLACFPASLETRP